VTHERRAVNSHLGQETFKIRSLASVTDVSLRKKNQTVELAQSRMRWLMNASDDHDAFFPGKRSDGGHNFLGCCRIQLEFHQ
jgi:hypothetical protein